MENKTVAEKLEALVKLQEIDSKLDEIKKVRGDLPEEVRDLEDEIAGQETRIGKFGSKVEELKASITERIQISKDAEALIMKYEEQQKNVRNNREFDALTKEVELQHLEIQISEKKVIEFNGEIDRKDGEIAEMNSKLDSRKKDLESKQGELEKLTQESEQDEEKLNKGRVKAEKKIELRLSTAYNRIRSNAKNGLAVVTVSRNACGGCFNIVPPQRQADINYQKKITVCEHCGRIFAKAEIMVEPEKKKKRRVTKKDKENA